MTDLEAIRARCAQSITEIVASPSEYFRVQQILRDREDLLALVDEAENSAGNLAEKYVALAVECDTYSRIAKERDHYMMRSALTDVEALRSALARALRLLRIGMDVGLEPHEKDEANALLAVLGHEPVRLSDQTEARR